MNICPLGIQCSPQRHTTLITDMRNSVSICWLVECKRLSTQYRLSLLFSWVEGKFIWLKTACTLDIGLGICKMNLRTSFHSTGNY